MLNIRLAHDAMMQFGGDDFEHEGKTIDGFKTTLKKAELYANPTNFDKWREVLGDVRKIREYVNIGKRMQSGEVIIGGQGGKTKEQLAEEAQKEIMRAMNAGSPTLLAQIPA